MSESFNLEPNNPAKMNPEDREINKEINLIGDQILEDINKEFQGEVREVKKEAYLAKNLLSDLFLYIKNNPNVDERMSLDEFTDIVNGKDGNFDPKLRDSINKFIDKYDTKINFSLPLSDFISFISLVWEENENLLNPGKEKIVEEGE